MSPKIPLVIFYSGFIQELPVFLLKRLPTMMLHLICNIFPHTGAVRGAYGERSVSWLPLKSFNSKFLVNPSGRCLFDVLNEGRKSASGRQANQQVNMVRRATDGLRNSMGCPDKSTEVFVQAWTPVVRDKWKSVLGAEDQVVVEAQVCRGHGWFRRPCGTHLIVGIGVQGLRPWLISVGPFWAGKNAECLRETVEWCFRRPFGTQLIVGIVVQGLRPWLISRCPFGARGDADALMETIEGCFRRPCGTHLIVGIVVQGLRPWLISMRPFGARAAASPMLLIGFTVAPIEKLMGVWDVACRDKLVTPRGPRRRGERP